MNIFNKIKLTIFWVILISSDTIAQLLLKMGSLRLKDEPGIKINYLIILGYSMIVISFLVWMQILKVTRLSIALAAASVLYITVAFASHYFMGEPITRPILLGTILISIGVFIIGYKEESRSSH